QFCSCSEYLTSFFQSCLPSARSKHRMLRSPPPLLAMVRKILSFQTIGVELPGCSSLTFHLTFSLALHVIGTFFSKQYPCPVGPRHAGQSSATAMALKQK